MLEGHDGIPSSNGENHEIDVLTYIESCETNESEPSYHYETFLSSSQMILKMELIANAKKYNDRIDKR